MKQRYTLGYERHYEYNGVDYDYTPIDKIQPTTNVIKLLQLINTKYPDAEIITYGSLKVIDDDLLCGYIFKDNITDDDDEDDYDY